MEGGPQADISSGDWSLGDLLKRAIDIVIAVTALIFFGPLMLLIGLAIRLDDGGPALFAHPRVGRDGSPFPCLKFRTMARDAPARLKAHLAQNAEARREWEQMRKLTNDPRITRLGKFLRISSLDELPQLINILRGEMSIVGPRPIVSEERFRYGRYFVHYCRLKPGLTGLWQVSGRNGTTYRRRVALDVRYYRARSIRLDLWIIMRTVPVVLAREGAH